jgi:phage terminase large subunit
VVSGIRKVQSAFREGRLFISPVCTDSIKEFSLYRWDEKAAGDTPKKENDHAMDDIRYFVSSVVDGNGDTGFFVLSTART